MDKAALLVQHALEFSYMFQVVLRQALKTKGPKVTCHLETNLTKVDRKIDEVGVFDVNDIMGALVVVDNIQVL